MGTLRVDFQSFQMFSPKFVVLKTFPFKAITNILKFAEYLLRASLVFHTIVPLIDLNNVT